MSAATDPGDGQAGSDDGEGKLAKAIITPAQTEAATLPAAIITPRPASNLPDPPGTPPDVPTVPGPPVCGNMAREEGEVCDSSVDPCCAQDCSALLPAQTVCRPANGACDVPESCDGQSRACPRDRVASAEQACRPSSGEPCDVGEYCNGETKDCPPDAAAPAGTVCGAPSMPCDAPELCDGVNYACPAPTVSVAPTTQVCRSANGPCDAAEHCDGVTYDCPQDMPAALGTECRPVRGVCDVAEVCDGQTFACPDDDFLFDEGTPCRPINPDTEPCGRPEYCFGQGPDCPPDEHNVDVLCRPANPTTCDAPEFCDGSTAQCPADAYLPNGAACNNGLGNCSANLCCPGDTKAGPDSLCEASDAHVVFVTSANVSGNLGIQGADKLCNDLARSANLAGPFAAWLSDSTLRNGGAVNRIADTSYALVDGSTIATDKAALVSPNGGVLGAISLTEWGQARETSVWTGTSALGNAMMDVSGLPLTCSDWVSNSANVRGETGLSVTNKPNWTEDTSAPCSTQLPVYCFPAAPAPVNGALVFVTRDPIAYLGDGLASIRSADAICAEAAAQADLVGTFVAWLSDGQTNAVDRILDRAYVRTDGKRVASSKADLTDGELENAIEYDQFGNPIDPYFADGFVWTGTKANGTAGQHCSGWRASDSLDGTVGHVTSTGSSWTELRVDSCGGPNHLYCFQAKAVIIDER